MGGFNLSTQHFTMHMQEECCDEAKTSDLLLGKPKGVDVGALEARRISA
jgi:hypothetical protein